MTDFVKISYFSIKWCPCSYRKGEPLTLNPLDITNFQLYLKQNGRPWLALTNKNFCSKSIFDEVIAFWKRWKVTRTPCMVTRAIFVKLVENGFKFTFCLITSPVFEVQKTQAPIWKWHKNRVQMAQTIFESNEKWRF